MGPDVRNPAFQRAIPHAMVIIGQLPKVVFFGVSPGCFRVLPRAWSQGPSGDGFEGCLRPLFSAVLLKCELSKPNYLNAIWIILERKLELRPTKRKSNSSTRTRTRIFELGPIWRTQARPRTPSLAELPLHFFSGGLKVFLLL